MDFKKQDLTVNCIYKDDGEDVKKIIEKSFHLFIKNKIAAYDNEQFDSSPEVKHVLGN